MQVGIDLIKSASAHWSHYNLRFKLVLTVPVDTNRDFA